ncbi:MAG: hypothetical protein ACREX9_03480 [Gammaproteobacteria bacterium]
MVRPIRVETVPQYLSLWRAGRLDLESLISKTAPLDQINRAMQDLKEGRGVRTVLLPSGQPCHQMQT